MDALNNTLVEASASAAENGARKLRNLLSNKGKFIYLYDHATGKVEKKYNLLRHCGTLWAMTTTARQPEFSASLEPKMLPAIISGLQWVDGKYGQTSELLPGIFLVWHDQVKLGGNALMILALAEYIDWLHAKRFDKFVAIDIKQVRSLAILTEAYVQGVYYFLASGQEFHKFNIRSLEKSDFQSDYYTGEALFALVVWQQLGWKLVNENVVTIDELPSLNKFPVTLNYMENLAEQNYGLEFQSHWMLYAVSELIRSKIAGMMAPQLYRYLENLIDAVLDNDRYRARNKSNPIACRTEGLLAAFRVYLPQHVANQPERQLRMQQTIEQNIMLQLQWVMPDGAIIAGSDSTMVQIDTLQHNISAFAAYIAWQRGQK